VGWCFVILDLHSPVIHIFTTTRRPVPYEMAFIPSARSVGNRTGGARVPARVSFEEYFFWRGCC